MQNTDANLFRYLANDSLYVLISGRWFTAPDESGPWQFVPGDKLPPDFKNIPDSSPKAVVKVSVPGTPQAQGSGHRQQHPAYRLGQPHNATTIPIDGPPKVAPVVGTPLSYVVNSEAPIIKIDDKTWYACQNGVWFVATSPSGPWSIAATVPAIIYTIPPSSPIYYVTYVRVYGVSPQYVYVGYTPGYYGTVIAARRRGRLWHGLLLHPGWPRVLCPTHHLWRSRSALLFGSSGLRDRLCLRCSDCTASVLLGTGILCRTMALRLRRGVYGRWGNDVYSGAQDCLCRGWRRGVHGGGPT